MEDYLPYLFSVDHCLDHGIFMLDKEIRIHLVAAQANPSNIMAVHIDGFKTAESASDRTADDILRDRFRSLDICLCSCELDESRNRRRYHQ